MVASFTQGIANLLALGIEEDREGVKRCGPMEDIGPPFTLACLALLRAPPTGTRAPGGGPACSPIGLTSTNILALAIDPVTPATLYAGTGGGVFRSTNGGGSWTAINTGLANLSVNALAIDPASPTTVIAGTEGGGAFMMLNTADNWGPLNLGLTNNRVHALRVDPTTSSIYAGTYGGRMFVLQ